ncbi:hypothetical protein Sjap_024746 [Stephania japonica]|uniref:F-box domain-containing protein n=1 Tax=Stephania japonica TaxID=461633 RepID=A0AAP0EML2_9MAGN
MTLPEDLINHIFSFLSPKKLIQTSLLSKKYRTFWSTVPISTNVSFAVTNVYSMNLFLQFLRGRLLNSTATSIERLSIQWWALCESRLINTLIESALQHSVQHLHISLNLRSKGVIVRSHNLSSYTLPPVLLSAPNLKTLTLDSVRLDGWVPMTCPDLEGLVLLCCRGQFNNLKGSSLGQLRRLEVVNYRSNGNDIGSMEMEAPRLECVSYRDEYGSIECSFFGSAEGWDAVDDCFNTCRIWTRLQQGIINNAASSSSSKMCQVPLELAHHVRVSAEGIFHLRKEVTEREGCSMRAHPGKKTKTNMNCRLEPVERNWPGSGSLLLPRDNTVAAADFFIGVGSQPEPNHQTSSTSVMASAMAELLTTTAKHNNLNTTPTSTTTTTSETKIMDITHIRSSCPRLTITELSSFSRSSRTPVLTLSSFVFRS